MKKSHKPTYAWDTSVFLAWLTDEASAPLDDIALVVEEIDKGEANLVVSVEIYSEILEAKHDPEQIARLEQFLKRSNVSVIDKHVPIAKKAGEIRSKALAEGRRLKTPDATVIATAIMSGADVLHSLDDRAHLNLSESPIVDGLKITLPRPFSGQKSLPYANGTEEPDSDATPPPPEST